MSDRRRAGNATTGVVLVLLIVAGVGGWNYHRNLQLEKAAGASHRPYENYASSDLEALREAYTAELHSVQADLAHSKSRRSQISRDNGSIAANVEQFAKTAVASARLREAAADVAERRAQIAELETELELRERFGQGMKRHLNLLLGLDGLFTG